MTCELITVWGKSGSGKTTFAVNLALALASHDYMVGIISSNLCYGELQTLLGQRIDEGKDLYASLYTTDEISSMYTASSLKSNLFMLSVANNIDALLMSTISKQSAEMVIEMSKLQFDFLIIDGSEDLNNAISSIGLISSDLIFAMYHPSVHTCLWHNSNKKLVDTLHIRDKIIPILNAYDRTCDLPAFHANIGLKFNFELPFVKEAKLFGNSGTPIYTTLPNKPGSYLERINEIVDYVINRQEANENG